MSSEVTPPLPSKVKIGRFMLQQEIFNKMPELVARIIASSEYALFEKKILVDSFECTAVCSLFEAVDKEGPIPEYIIQVATFPDGMVKVSAQRLLQNGQIEKA